MARRPARPTDDEIDSYHRFPSMMQPLRLAAVDRWLGWCRANGKNALYRAPKRKPARAKNQARTEGHTMDDFLRAQVAGSQMLSQGAAKEIASGIGLILPRRKR